MYIYIYRPINLHVEKSKNFDHVPILIMFPILEAL